MGLILQGRCPRLKSLQSPLRILYVREAARERRATCHGRRESTERPQSPGCVRERQTVTVLRSVSFEFDSAKLTEEARRTLDRVAAGLKGQPSMRVEIAGHTDALGTEAYNLRLSRERATSVRDFLVDLGVAASRLDVKGYGESKPVADNETDAGRARNRRVNFSVLTR